MKNKGYILTWDALLALMIVILTFATLLSLGYLNFSPGSGSASFERLHFLGEDTLDVLNKNGILAEIVSSWSQNDTGGATELADSYLKNLTLIPSRFGYRLEINNKNISERTLKTPENEITAKTNVVRFVSGFGINKTPDVWVARAWLWYNDSGVIKTYESVTYGNSFRFSLGANWTFDYSGMGTAEDICIPPDCSGDDEHTYDGSPIETDDALDDAMYRLLDKLDTDTPNDGEIDLPFDSDNMLFKTSSVSTKQFDSKLVEVKLILWI